MNISNGHLIQIFGMNIGHKASGKLHSGGKLIHKKDSPVIVIGAASYYDIVNGNIPSWSIIKKPLYEITEEHAIEISKMCEESSFIKVSRVKEENRICISTTSTMNGDRQDRTIYIGSDGSSVLLYNDGNWNGSGYKQINTIAIYQYLHALGYALSITLLDENNNPITYSVDDLVKAGVYKLN